MLIHRRGPPDPNQLTSAGSGAKSYLSYWAAGPTGRPVLVLT